jgi:hypothetical protein
MTFDDWAELLNLRAETFEGFPPDKAARKAWRCDGPCGQLMYGISRDRGWNYPNGNIPGGSYISKELPRVCNVCHALYYYYVGHPDEKVQDRIQAYWDAIRIADKDKFGKLKSKGDYLA